MSLTTLAYVMGAVIAGSLIAFQAPLNASAALKLGHPLAGAILSFIAGLVALLVLAAFVARDSIDISQLRGMAPHVLLGGGLLGAAYVTSNIFLTPRLGVAAFIALGIAGQLLAGLVLDHFGLLGAAERAVSTGRIAGAALVMIGAVLVSAL